MSALFKYTKYIHTAGCHHTQDSDINPWCNDTIRSVSGSKVGRVSINSLVIIDDHVVISGPLLILTAIPWTLMCYPYYQLNMTRCNASPVECI